MIAFRVPESFDVLAIPSGWDAFVYQGWIYNKHVITARIGGGVAVVLSVEVDRHQGVDTMKWGHTSKLLICEGPCNGGLVQETDALIREYGRSEGVNKDDEKVSVTNLPRWVLDQIRRFIYTPHKWFGVDANGYGRYACEHCHTIRRY